LKEKEAFDFFSFFFCKARESDRKLARSKVKEKEGFIKELKEQLDKREADLQVYYICVLSTAGTSICVFPYCRY